MYHLQFLTITASMLFTINQNFCRIGYSRWGFSLENMKHALLLHHWGGLEMNGTLDEHVQMELYRNKSSNTKPEHISNFSTVVSDHQPLRQLCQNCGSGRADEEGAVLTGPGDVRKRQLDAVDAHGRCHGRGAGAGTGSRCFAALVKGGRLELYKCLAPAWQQEVTQNGRGGGAGTLHRQKH